MPYEYNHFLKTDRKGQNKGIQRVPVGQATYTIYKQGNTIIAEPSPDTGLRKYAGTDASTVIQNAINAGHNIYIREGTYTITSTLQQPAKNITITGAGVGLTILSGSADPILQSNTDPVNKMIVSNINIQTTSNNRGIYLTRAWTAAPNPSDSLHDIYFYAQGNAGKLLDIYGSREGNFYNLYFYSFLVDTSTATAISLRGDAQGGAMNLSFVNCSIYYIQTAYDMNASVFGQLAGIRVIGNTIIGVVYPFTVINTNSLQIMNCMVDNNYGKISFTGLSYPVHLVGNYFGMNSNAIANTNMIEISNSCYFFYIVNNYFQDYHAVADRGDAIAFSSSTADNGYIWINNNEFNQFKNALSGTRTAPFQPSNIFIQNNQFNAAAYGLNFDRMNGGLIYTNRFETDVINPISITSQANMKFIYNEGFNPVALSQPAVGASPFTWTNNLGYPVVIYFYAQPMIVEQILRGGAWIAVANAGTANTVMLYPGDAIQITYAGAAPTMTVQPM